MKLKNSITLAEELNTEKFRNVKNYTKNVLSY